MRYAPNVILGPDGLYRCEGSHCGKLLPNQASWLKRRLKDHTTSDRLLKTSALKGRIYVPVLPRERTREAL
jgi:hypothetical protein